ncbi:MAG TPA: hypothetical protein VF715_10410 [Thermoleophilaceae bacterium]|jgi:hypothetical protein
MTATSVSIRRAGPHDAPALCRLAALDSASPLRGEVLMAEVDGVALAALSLSDGACVADPFSPTAELLALLRVRRQQLGGVEPPRGRGVRRLLRWAPQLARL